MGRFVYWVTGVRADQNLTSQQKLHPVLQDSKLLKQLKMQLKLFEICLRIFEQECIQTVIETQKEVQNQNIDLLVTQEKMTGRGSPRTTSLPTIYGRNPQQIKYVENQLLDKTGALLEEHCIGKAQRVQVQLTAPLQQKDVFLQHAPTTNDSTTMNKAHGSP